MYPTKMEANGHIYKINTDYRVALACFKALYDTEINDIERFYAIETLLLGPDVDEADDVILKDKIEKYLSCEREENIESDEERDYDYVQDEDLTKVSIRQCYNNFDVGKLEYLHWYEYNELIEGLTDECAINRVREIRTTDVSKIDDQRQKEKILKAQERYAIKEHHKKTKEEEEIDEFWAKIERGGRNE